MAKRFFYTKILNSRYQFNTPEQCLITLTSHWELLFLMEYQIMMIQLKIIRSSLSEALFLGSEQLNLNFQEH